MKKCLSLLLLFLGNITNSMDNIADKTIAIVCHTTESIVASTKTMLHTLDTNPLRRTVTSCAITAICAAATDIDPFIATVFIGLANGAYDLASSQTSSNYSPAEKFSKLSAALAGLWGPMSFYALSNIYLGIPVGAVQITDDEQQCNGYTEECQKLCKEICLRKLLFSPSGCADYCSDRFLASYFDN